jgi:hypothetical protein
MTIFRLCQPGSSARLEPTCTKHRSERESYGPSFLPAQQYRLHAPAGLLQGASSIFVYAISAVSATIAGILRDNIVASTEHKQYYGPARDITVVDLVECTGL